MEFLDGARSELDADMWIPRVDSATGRTHYQHSVTGEVRKHMGMRKRRRRKKPPSTDVGEPPLSARLTRRANSESSMMPSSLSADASEFVPPPCDDIAAADAAVEQHVTLGRQPDLQPNSSNDADGTGPHADALGACMSHLSIAPEHPEEAGFAGAGTEELEAEAQAEAAAASCVGEEAQEAARRRFWAQWAIRQAELERERRVLVLEALRLEEEGERCARRAWAVDAIAIEQRERHRAEFLRGTLNTQWFQGLVEPGYDVDYEVACPNHTIGCNHTCPRSALERHLLQDCVFGAGVERHQRQAERDALAQALKLRQQAAAMHRRNNGEGEEEGGEGDFALTDEEGVGGHPLDYEIMCPNATLGCNVSYPISQLQNHLQHLCMYSAETLAERAAAERGRIQVEVIAATEAEQARRVEAEAVARRMLGERKMLQRQRLLREQQRQLQLQLLAKCGRRDGEAAAASADPGDELDRPPAIHRTSYRDAVAQPQSAAATDGAAPQQRCEPPKLPHDAQPSSPLPAELVSPSPAWNLTRCMEAKTLKLHQMLHAYIGEVAAKHSLLAHIERPARVAAVARVRSIVHALWPSSRVAVFGSLANGLCLGGTASDIDVVVFGCDGETADSTTSFGLGDQHGVQSSGRSTTAHSSQARRRQRSLSAPEQPTQLAALVAQSGEEGAGIAAAEAAAAVVRRRISAKCLAQHFRSHPMSASWARGVTTLDKATVPLVKLQAPLGDITPGGHADDIRIDITFGGVCGRLDEHAGIAAAALVRRLTRLLPELRPLVLVVKHFLCQQSLNDPYTGGLSSYGLVLMLAFIILRNETKVADAAAAEAQEEAVVAAEEEAAAEEAAAAAAAAAAEEEAEAAAATTPEEGNAEGSSLAEGEQAQKAPAVSEGPAASSRVDQRSAVQALAKTPPRPSVVDTSAKMVASSLEMAEYAPGRRLMSAHRSLRSVMSPRSHLVQRRETRASADGKPREVTDGVSEGEHVVLRHARPQQVGNAAWCVADGSLRPSNPRRVPPLAGRWQEHLDDQNKDAREWAMVLESSSTKVTVELKDPGAEMSVGDTEPLRSRQRLPDQHNFLHDGGRESQLEAQQRAIGEHVADVLVNATNCRRSGVRAAPAMGELLLDFLSYFGERFEPGREGCSLRHGSFRFDLMRPSAMASGSDGGASAGLTLEDPLCLTNNVGRSCYRTAELQHAFATMKARLDTFMVHEATLDGGIHPLMGRGWARPAKHIGADQDKGRPASGTALSAADQPSPPAQHSMPSGELDDAESSPEERPGAMGYSRLLENVKALNAIFAR